jgi:hypothetical protein
MKFTIRYLFLPVSILAVEYPATSETGAASEADVTWRPGSLGLSRRDKGIST